MSSTSDFFDCPKCGGNAHREQDNRTCDIYYGCSNCDWKGEPVSMRKVTIEIKVKLLLNVDENADMTDVLDDIDYEFVSNHDSAFVVDTEITDYEVKDSR
jgi:hypothetical protein